MAYRKKSMLWTVLTFVGVAVVAVKFQSEIKTWIGKIPMIGPMIFPETKNQ